MSGVIDHWVAGVARPGTRERFSTVTDAATGEVTGRLALAAKVLTTRRLDPSHGGLDLGFTQKA